MNLLCFRIRYAVMVAVPLGALYVSDDKAGMIYRISYKGAD